MGGIAVSQLIPQEDKAWWTTPDEGYWRALLEQGEIAPDIAPPGDFQETFRILDLESRPGSPAPPLDGDGDRDMDLDPEQAWRVAQKAMDRGENFDLIVSGANRGGLLVDWNGLQGFVPASHLVEIPHNQDPRQRVGELAQHIGQSKTVRLIEVDPLQNRLVFSERAALSEFCSPAKILSSLRPGDVCKGVVTNLTSFGAFVDLGGVEGLVHVSELSWDRVRHPRDVLRPGQNLEVCVLGVNEEEGRIALSLKRLRPNPWSDAESRYYAGQLIEGEVTNVVSFGAFVRLEEGLEGLIHVSELADGNFLHPRNVIGEGDLVRVRVLNIDAQNQRLGLSLRKAHDDGPGAAQE
jgi:small subunit ribosomal protein S1